MNAWAMPKSSGFKINRFWIFITFLFMLGLLIERATFYSQMPYTPSRLLAIIPTFIIAVPLLFSSPFKAFLAFVITLPLEATLTFELGFTIRLSYILLLVLIFYMIVFRGRWFSKSPLDVSIIAYLAVCSLSIIQTILVPPPQVALSESMRFRGTEIRSVIQLLLLYFYSLTYFFTVYFCSNKRKLDLALKTYIGVALIISTYGVYQAFAAEFNLPLKSVTNALSTGGSGYESVWVNVPFQYYRSTATFQEPLNFGHYLLSVLPFLIAFLVTKGSYVDFKNRKWLGKNTLVLIIFMMIIALFMTRSRGAWIGFVGAMFVAMLGVNSKYRVRMLGILLGGLIILQVFAYVSSTFTSGSISVIGIINDRYASQLLSRDPRLDYWRAILVLWSKSPLLGLGIGNFGIHAADFYGTSNVFGSGGMWWTVLAEEGIIGLAIFAWMVVAYCRILIKNLIKFKGTLWHPYIVGCLACFSGMMIQNFFSNARLPQYEWFFMGISMATVKLANTQSKKNV